MKYVLIYFLIGFVGKVVEVFMMMVVMDLLDVCCRGGFVRFLRG